MPTMEEIQSYVPPPISEGECVLFHQDADPNLNPYVGFVTHCDGRSIEIISISRNGLQSHPEVHHITDPLIKANEHIKRYGGWSVNRRVTDAANVHLVLKAYEDRTETRIRELEDRIQRLLDTGFKEHAPPAVVPEVAEAITPADVGLSPSQFLPAESQIIEAGEVKNTVNWEKVKRAIGADTMRAGHIADKLGASKDQVADILKNNPDAFEHIGAGWFKTK